MRQFERLGDCAGCSNDAFVMSSNNCVAAYSNCKWLHNCCCASRQAVDVCLVQADWVLGFDECLAEAMDDSGRRTVTYKVADPHEMAYPTVV
jgi:hypothetical protein